MTAPFALSSLVSENNHKCTRGEEPSLSFNQGRSLAEESPRSLRDDIGKVLRYPLGMLLQSKLYKAIVSQSVSKKTGPPKRRSRQFSGLLLLDKFSDEGRSTHRGNYSRGL